MYSLKDLQSLSQVSSTQQRFAQDAQRSVSSKDISLRGITLSFGTLSILKDAHIRLTYGTKYALIGRNGIGKTTLLRCMANNMIPQWTSIRTYFIQQEFNGIIDDQMSPVDLVKQSDPDHQSLLQSITDAENDIENNIEDNVDQLTELYDQLSIFESEMERRALNILSDLKFTKEMMNAQFHQLSGGWRMKVMLSCAVFAQPHLLLLDEPTNHLDIKSIQWLISYLKGLDCTVVVVSHDHDFLDRYSECIIHLTQKELRYYPGNLSDFQLHRQDKFNNQANVEKKIQLAKESGSENKLRRLDGPKVKKMSKKNMADLGWVWGGEALIQGQEGYDDKIIKFRFPDPDSSVSDPLLQLKNATFGLEGGRILWENIDLSIDRTSRITILGKNGLGKSCLLKCIANLEKLKSGEILRHHNLRIAFFTQHLIQEIDLTKSAVELLIEKFREVKSQEARDYLGSFGICGDLALQRLGVLSGGQKVRFVFAMLLFEHPHLLLLDEPTSHLDMEMTESLLNALNRFKGAIILISHHVFFLRQLQSCQHYAISKKRLCKLESLDQYVSK